MNGIYQDFVIHLTLMWWVGASRLFNFFIKKYNPIRIVSYADKDWSIGGLYYKLGFKLINDTKPDYKYVINEKRIHKSNYKKSKNRN